MGSSPSSGDDERRPAGRFVRPETSVLGEESLIPAANLIRPPPTHFTHEVRGATPFSFGADGGDAAPDGELPAGTKVVLLTTDGDHCHVVDDRGLYVRVRCDSLTELAR